MHLYETHVPVADGGWFWATALHDFLEYGVGRYLLIPHYVVQLV